MKTRRNYHWYIMLKMNDDIWKAHESIWTQLTYYQAEVSQADNIGFTHAVVNIHKALVNKCGANDRIIIGTNLTVRNKVVINKNILE